VIFACQFSLAIAPGGRNPSSGSWKRVRAAALLERASDSSVSPRARATVADVDVAADGTIS